MATKPIPTIPVSENENLLRKKFHESVAAQSDLMDTLSKRLLTLELGIPGLFASDWLRVSVFFFGAAVVALGEALVT